MHAVDCMEDGPSALNTDLTACAIDDEDEDDEV